MEERYRNYLKHEDTVRVIDGILKHQQDWSWFVDKIESDFDLDDITNWQEYLSKQGVLAQTYRLFIKIRRIYSGDFKISNPLLADITLIADFFIGIIERTTCIAQLQTEFGKLFLLVVWLTKLENTENNTDYLWNINFLNKRNYWAFVSCNSVLESREEILAHTKEIHISDWEVPLSCLNDNLNRVEYSCSEDFFDKYGEHLYNANAFCWRQFQDTNALTWEEAMLLDMVNITISDKEIIPVMKSTGGSYPDFSQWTQSRISHMLEFFRHPIATFILESVRYILYDVVPDISTVLAHCELFADYIEKNQDSFFRCSSFQILSSLFKESKIKKVWQEPQFKSMLEQIHCIKDSNILQKLNDAAFPVLPEQKLLVRQHAETAYKTLDSIKTVFEFENYIRNPEVQHYIPTDYFIRASEKFQELLPQSQNAVPHLFYHYMCYLFAVKERNDKLNKYLVQQEMINVQHLWQNHYYKQYVEGMQVFTWKQEVPKAEIEALNHSVMSNPIQFAASSVIYSEDGFIQVMKDISANAFSALASRMEISLLYPIPEEISFVRHDIDTLLISHINKILETHGYIFLNRLKPEDYIQGILEHMSRNVKILVSMLNVQELYNKVLHIHDKPFDLIEWSDNLSLSHITQLFPFLESKLRDLSEQSGIFPFKENKNSFMQHKDPSSILREIISAIYEETGNFDIVPDALFVYYFMYNSNSLNIRNDCIHGRKYCTPEELPFALGITCLSILMVEQRIESILTSVEKETT